MADNVTPVVLKVKDFAEREVLLVDYKFNQATDTEGQVAGIVRGGQITIRVKALIPEHQGRFSYETAEGHWLLLCTLQGVLGRRRGALRGSNPQLPEAREWSCSI